MNSLKRIFLRVLCVNGIGRKNFFLGFLEEFAGGSFKTSLFWFFKEPLSGHDLPSSSSLKKIFCIFIPQWETISSLKIVSGKKLYKNKKTAIPNWKAGVASELTFMKSWTFYINISFKSLWDIG